jgi:predicted Zn-dependent protease
MKSIIRAAFVATLLCTAASVVAPAQAADKLGREVGPPIVAAQKALQAGDYATALAKVKEAQAVADKTPYEDYIVNTFLAQVYIQQKDYADATGPLEAAADSPAIPDDQKQSTYFNAFQLAFQAKHYAKAIGYGQQLQALKPLDPLASAMMAQAYYETKDTANAQKFAKMSVDASKAAGQTPNEFASAMLLQGQATSHDDAGVKAGLEDMALNYNKPNTWSELVDMTLNGKNVKDIDVVYLLRLKMLMPEAMRETDYQALASGADQFGYSTEAYDVLQKGIARGKITTAQAGPELAHARSGAAADQKSLGSIAASAEKAKTGKEDFQLAEDYWGYGRFADAETAVRRAISKGGLKDPSQGPMLLGMTLVAQGKYDEGIQTLSQVSGSPTRNSTAHLWSLYAQAQKKTPSTAAQH